MMERVKRLTLKSFYRSAARIARPRASSRTVVASLIAIGYLSACAQVVAKAPRHGHAAMHDRDRVLIPRAGDARCASDRKDGRTDRRSAASGALARDEEYR
jgi:hypothetical protein